MYKIENDTIRFSHNYDDPLSKNLLEIIRLNNINQLVFGMNFNQSLENLPSCVKTIIFKSFHYDCPLDNLSNGVETLKLSKFYDRNIDNLPLSVQTIYFGEFFNQKLDELPFTIKNLYFPITGKFNKKLSNLPEGLETIFLPREYYRKFDNLPKNLKKIIVHQSYPYMEELKKIVSKKDILNTYIF